VTNSPLTLDRVRAALGQDYEIVRLLGAGGMGTVFLAREKALKRLVAIKVLDPHLGASPIFRNRFQLEAETAAQLQHPNIVPIYRVGEADGLSYFSMGYIEGESLADRMRGVGRLSPRESRRIAGEVAAALGAAHRRGIIHRDVKPQNVLLDRETGRAMVTDFGIASVAAASSKGDDDRLTSAGMVMGTPRYMSPEQASGIRDLTPASDLYALGIILYEMLCGDYPYRLGQPPNYTVSHITGAVIPLVTRVGDVPKELEGITNRLLAKDPLLRFRSAEELSAAIEGSAISGSATMAVPVQRVQRRRRAGLVIAVVAALLAGAMVATRGRSDLPKGVDSRKSILIGYFDNTTQDPSLAWLRVGGVDLLAQALGRWQDLTVIDAERLLDLTRRARIPMDRRLSQDDVLRLARDAGVWTATLGSVVRVGDSLLFTIRVYDVANRKQLLSAQAMAADKGDIQPAFRVLAGEILDVAGAPRTGLLEMEPPTRSFAAYQAYIEGIQLRNRWSIDSAELAFRRAVTEDPEFALAYYELSQALAWSERASPNPTFIAYADSARRYAAKRPPRERQMLESFSTLMHGDIPAARRGYEALAVSDSLNPDVWGWLGLASQLDLTLQAGPDGRERLPAEYTKAMRSYMRAIELDGSDHRTYLNLASLLSSVATKDGQGVPGFRDPLSGNITTLGFRTPARWYSPVLRGDSILLVPAESLSLRFSARVLDSLRTSARDRAIAVVRRWLAVAPDEGEAYMLLTTLDYADRSYDKALRSLAKAESLGANFPVPLPIQRLAILLAARRLEAAIPLGDSLSPAGGRGVSLGSPLFGTVIANYELTRGRVSDATALARARLNELQRFEQSEQVRRRLAMGAASLELRMAARAGTVTAAQVTQADAMFRKAITDAPDAMRPELRRSAAPTMLVAAAALGDTATSREWRTIYGTDSLLSLDATAAVVAGDRARAAKLLERAERDTTPDADHFYALGITAEALGRPAAALRYFQRLDSLNLDPGSTANPDWLLLARAIARRGTLAAQLGDTASAKAEYDRFLRLWSDPDPALRKQRDMVARQRWDLERRESR
jgi:tetratricopeptide (TPR) repeat protein